MNPWPGAELPPLGAMPRWMAQRLRGRLDGTLPPAPDPAVFPVASPDIVMPRAGVAECRVTWVGHSTCLLQVGGVNLLTDPVWSRRASPLRSLGPRRLVPAAVPLAALPPLDVVLMSHNHYDHYDAATIAALSRAHPDAQWLCPLGLAPSLRDLGVGRTTEFDWWQERTIATAAGPVEATATPAQHFSGRTPFDRNATLWCGFALAAARWRVLFVGDSGLHPEFERIGEDCGPFDVVLMPVGAYQPRWFMRPVHMDPDEALEAFEALAPAGGPSCRMVPIHWGTFKLTDEPMEEPPRRTAALWAARGRPADDLWLLRHGETRVATT